MKSLLFSILTLSILGTLLYLLVQKNQVAPSESTIAVAKQMQRYPNAKFWDIETDKRFCLDFFFDCDSRATIAFAASDPWPSIYNYYIPQMKLNGWDTNSRMYTSTPTTIIFTKQNCETVLSPRYKFNSDIQTGNLTFEISCNAKVPVL